MRNRCCTVGLFLTALLMSSAPLYSQVDLAGQWASRMHEDQLERGPGPKPGEYQGLPINDADRMRADSWTASLWTVPEHQCIPHPADYGPSFSSLRIWKDLDPVTHALVAWRTEFAWMNATRTIWMDRRPYPPEYAAHTWQGFSTGVWEGDMLTVTTTHLKPAYLRRNGLARSEKATVREHFIRNGDVLTIITIITDPVYLTEPYIRSRNFYLDPGFQIPSYPCTIETEVERPEGVIPHFLPGENPDLAEFAAEHHLPLEAVRGGAETMYPEYMLKIRSLPSAKLPNEPAEAEKARQ